MAALSSSHASPNTGDGLNQFDGSDDQYFAPGAAGDHALWKSKCFDFAKKEVAQFLLGQLLCFAEMYHVDGFRFDGVTSILYTDHAIDRGFNGDYRDYFGFHSHVAAEIGSKSDQRGRAGVSDDGEPAPSRADAAVLLHRRGRFGLPAAGESLREGRRGVRFPDEHGRGRHVDPTEQGEPRRRLERERHPPHHHQSQVGAAGTWDVDARSDTSVTTNVMIRVSSEIRRWRSG